MNRRSFLRNTIAAVAGGTMIQQLAVAAVERVERDVRITGVKAYDVRFHRPKMVGKNARLDVHGDSGGERFLELSTSAGVTGVGWANADEATAAKMLGSRPADWFKADRHGFACPLGNGTAPLWDLLGKLDGRPVYELLAGKGGPKGPEKVRVYDGSIYFADLLPDHADDWREQFKREIGMAHEAGHTAFKIKIGRGAKWMPRDAGDARDIEVIRLFRETCGPDATIGVDANNGYDLAGTKRLMEQVGPLNLAFTEEMFPETVEDCGALKAFYKEKGWETLLADGETQHDMDKYQPLVDARAIDVLQGDIRHYGFEGMARMSAMASGGGARIAPHNWGSIAGYYMMLHVGRAVDNFYMAENDPGRTPVLVADGFDRADGTSTVPDTPGLGVDLRPDLAPGDVRVLYELST